jgi:hypothetical protein
MLLLLIKGEILYETKMHYISLHLLLVMVEIFWNFWCTLKCD